jgi:sec-independent protein translocase protein TatC
VARKGAPAPGEERKLTYTEHLSELRRRIILSVVAVVGCAIAAFSLKDHVLEAIRRPVADLTMVFLTPAELFMAYVKISIMAGLMVAAPFIFFQVWMFVRPGLTRKERVGAAAAIVSGSLFFVVGALFGYLVMLPMTMHFFLQYQTATIRASISFGAYVGFLTSVLVSFGVAFELPLLLVLLTRLRIVNHMLLAKSRKYALLIILVAAAVLTPGPDIVSQIMLAAPMLVLYELSILGSRLFRVKPRDDEVAAGAAGGGTATP